ncbi:MAG: HAD-IA family hydrolase [Gammaproteobacteria bacterium]|nr:HAD-IA family hydrolase [Gammaproteobacteria bacterium]
MYRTILFDLDGTLVDTAPDLAYALNVLRSRRGLPPLADNLTRPQASHGTQGLLRVGFGITQEQAEFSALREEFLAVYASHLTVHSPMFPGVAEMLTHLEARGLKWGVVTNKPARYTEPLLDHLGLLARASCVVSGDTCAQPKPHPAPMWHACKLTASDPAECLYVGDAERDVSAAAAIGIPTLVALYGYLGEDDRPEAWGAHGFIEAPLALLDWLQPDA